MDKRVLLIGIQKSFMVNAISKGLQKEGFEVVSVDPIPESVAITPDKPNIAILYLGDMGETGTRMLSYLHEHIDEDKIVLFLVGNSDELKIATTIIGKEKIHQSFLRPLDVNALVDKLNAIMEYKEVDESLRKKILIIDDDGAMLRMMKTWLSIKYQVYMASTGSIALTFLSANPVDLVLLDYEMPIMNGPEVLKTMRADPKLKDIPVIFLTAKDDKESVLTAAYLKPEKYLLKSMPQGKLLGAIDDFFAAKENRNRGNM